LHKASTPAERGRLILSDPTIAAQAGVQGTDRPGFKEGAAALAQQFAGQRDSLATIREQLGQTQIGRSFQVGRELELGAHHAQEESGISEEAKRRGRADKILQAWLDEQGYGMAGQYIKRGRYALNLPGFEVLNPKGSGRDYVAEGLNFIDPELRRRYAEGENKIAGYQKIDPETGRLMQEQTNVLKDIRDRLEPTSRGAPVANTNER